MHNTCSRSIRISACIFQVVLIIALTLFLMLACLYENAYSAAPVANAGNEQTIVKDQLLSGYISLDSTLSSDPDGDQLTYLWFGPFSTSDEANPEVSVPDGTYTMSLIVSDETERSSADTAVITTAPCFSIASRAKSGLVQITWTDIVGTQRYDVFRADENDPSTFEKIAETTSIYSTYLDTTITNETTYLYIVGALSEGDWCFSDIVSSHPTAIRTRSMVNYEPFIYSQPIEHGTVGIIYNYDVNAADPNADVLSYNLLNQPDGMMIDSSSGLISWTPSETGTYDVTVEIDDGSDGTDSQSFTIEVVSIPPLNRHPVADTGGPYFCVIDQEIQFDGTLSHDPDEDSLSFEWDFGDGAYGSGSTSSHIYQDANTYIVTLTVDDGRGATATANTTATVYQPPTVSISADPSVIVAGESSTLTWTSTDGVSASIDNGIGTVEVNGTIQVSPSVTTTYTITANGLGSIASDRVTITVNPAISPPNIDSFTAACGDNPIQLGSSTTLSWQCLNTDATSVFIEPIGTVGMNESPLSVSPSVTTTYTLMVTSSGGVARANATVMVTCDKIPFSEGSFAKQYEDLVPNDSTVSEYDEKRFSIITGMVVDIDNLPIDSVSVTVLGRPEYGTAKTDAEGRFSLPVEGGSTMTLKYDGEGYLSVQRQVYVPYNDIPVSEKVIMIQTDTKATTIILDGNPETIFTHESSMSNDDDGQRSCTLAISGDTTAYAVDRDGNAIQKLPNTFTVKVTEYTVGESGPQAMPAYLPPNVAYTYCSELTIDGVDRVQFSKPVIAWVDNFLGFEVGSTVPVGYYDRDKGVWVPSENGIVVMLLDTNADAIVDALDTNGDNEPNDLDNDGELSDEVEGLADVQRYQAGSTFWRFETTHFSPWDCNWPYGPPFGATPPNPQAEPAADEQLQKEEDCQEDINSSIDERSRIFHEDVPIPGTNMSLHYASSRVAEYKTLISIPVSGDTVPADLKEIIVNVSLAGRTFDYILDALPDQKMEFFWDGLDHMGRKVVGPKIANVCIGFVYDAVYYSPAEFDSSFAQAGQEITGIPSRQEIILWKSHTIRVVPSLARLSGRIGEGWSLSPHHYLNPSYTSILHKGNGEIIENNCLIIDTVAGNGVGGFGGDGGIATDARLAYPFGVAVDANGNIYIADIYNNRIRKVDTSGIITTVAGNGYRGFSGDSGPAADASLNRPEGVAVDTAGNIYIADTSNRRIRKVDTSGKITTIAGNGVEVFSGDGGPATDAGLTTVDSVVVDTIGNIYIVGGYRIRKVDMSGKITTIAGDGVGGFSGDGGPATDARIYCHHGVSVDAIDNIYIADTYNNRIRKVDTSGNITTIAGNGVGGFRGDGGPATDARLAYPQGAAVDAFGNIYITDTNNNRIRKVSIPSLFMSYINAGDIPLSDSNGLGYIMDYAGRHKTTIDLNTCAVLYTFGYDSYNNLISITNRFNEMTILEYDNGVPTTIISPDGIVTTLSIDSNNHLTDVIYPDGSSYHFEYTDDGLMTIEQDPNLNQFDHWYDETGRITDVYDPEGGHWIFNRQVLQDNRIQYEVITGENNVTTYVDSSDTLGYTSIITVPSVARTEYFRSADGMNVEKSLSCGKDLSFEYGVDPQYKFKYIKQVMESTAGLQRVTSINRLYNDTDVDNVPDLITQTITVNAKTTTVEKNTLNTTMTLISPSNRTIATIYDPVTLLTTDISVFGLNDTSYWYDGRGRPTLILNGSRQTIYAYDDSDINNRIVTITDPRNLTTTFHYNAMDRLFRVDQADAKSLYFDYDNNGNMTVLTKPSPAPGTLIDHIFGFNGVNLLDFYQTPISGGYSYEYNKDRQLIATNFPSGKWITNTYSNTRLTQILSPESAIDITYACSSKIDTITRGSERITYGYGGSLLTSEAISGTLNQTLSYSYNNDFNIDTFTYAGGDPVLYTYDDDGLLTGTGPYTISRNAGNGLPEAVYNGTLVISRTFNGYTEKDSQTLSVGYTTYAWNLKYDNSGRITDKEESIGGTTENSVYTYDLMGRLLSVTRDGILTEEYAYGENGARISEMNTRKGIIIPRSLSYSDEDQVLIAGEVIYIYDVDGFLQTKVDGSGTMTYTYSTLGELLCVELPDSTLIEYEYDPLNRRIAKKVDGVVVEKYLWSGLTTLLAVYNPDDTLRQRFVYVDARMPVAMEMDGSSYYLSYDQVGSIRVVADASGNVQKLIEYDTFGYVLSDSNPAFEIPLGFAGGVFDKDIGLIRFGARDYDPDTGRWTAKDPIRFAGGDADLYGYCVNDPVNLVDPKGLFGDGIRRGDSRLGHSDIFSGDRYDFTKEDHGPTSPYNQPSRHFRDLGDVERDLNDAIRRGDLDSFERHMHQGQDYFSHTENGYKWDPFHGKFGHLFAPDFLNFGPDYDLGAFIDANYWSENWIWKWEQRRNNPCR